MTYPWRSWQCETHDVWFSPEQSLGDWTECVAGNCKVLAYHSDGRGGDGVFVRSLLFDHEHYPWLHPDFLPIYMEAV